MEIAIKTKNLKLTPSLKNFITKKINSLEKFFKILYSEEYFRNFFGKGKPIVEAWVEIGKETEHHKKGPFFRAECQMRFPGKIIITESVSKDLRLAIDETKGKLKRELKEYKEKIMAKQKRGAKIFKKELKISPQARLYRKGRIREEGI